MAIQTNMSKKDKATIAILIFAAAIFMIIWFLIRPAITTIRNTDEKILQAELKQTQNRNKITLLSSSDAVYGKSVQDLTSSTVEFYGLMDSSEIDRMVTSYVLKSGLFAEDLVINMPAGYVKESPYVYSTLNTKNTKNTANNSAASKPTTTPAPTKKPGTTASANTNTTVEGLTVPYNTARDRSTSTEFSGVQCVGLKLVCTGSQSVCQAFIDDISTKPAVRVTGFTWSKVEPVEIYNEETGRSEQKDSGKVRLTITFNLYMTEIADYSAVTPDSAT